MKSRIEELARELALKLVGRKYIRVDECSFTITTALNEALELAAKECDRQSTEPECPERAKYCAEAIRKLKV